MYMDRNVVYISLATELLIETKALYLCFSETGMSFGFLYDMKFCFNVAVYVCVYSMTLPYKESKLLHFSFVFSLLLK